jgi:hypothetical protein
MIDERFSRREFERRGRDSEAAADLARELQLAVQQELLPTLKEASARIVARLNAMGHELQLQGAEAGDLEMPLSIVYRHEYETADGEVVCYLRLALDLVVSAAYARLLTEEELIKQYSGVKDTI